jgi:hypothetical protein
MLERRLVVLECNDCAKFYNGGRRTERRFDAFEQACVNIPTGCFDGT